MPTKKPNAKQKKQISFNKRHGLLCACNKVRVPYFPAPSHGTKNVNGVLHGYYECHTVSLVHRVKPEDLFTRMVAVHPGAARLIAKALDKAKDCTFCTDGTKAQYDAIYEMRDVLRELADEAGVPR